MVTAGEIIRKARKEAKGDPKKFSESIRRQASAEQRRRKASKGKTAGQIIREERAARAKAQKPKTKTITFTREKPRGEVQAFRAEVTPRIVSPPRRLQADPQTIRRRIPDAQQGTITEFAPPEDASPLQRAEFEAARLRARAETQEARRQPVAAVTGIAAGGISSALGTIRFGKEAFTDPVGTTKRVGSGLLEVGKLVIGKNPELAQRIGTTIRREPGFVVGLVSTEVATAKGLGSALKLGGRAAGLARARVSPKFTPVKEGSVALRSGKTIQVVGGTQDVLEPVGKQARLAGTRVDAVSAARSLIKPLRPAVKVDKPIPPGAPQLERAFFADPRARLRTTRLGITETKPAGLADILSGDVKLGFGEKPQAIFFPDTPVAKFPRGLLGVQKKLRAGQPLTTKEAAALQRFQLTPAGKFKPVGFLSKEAEVTLAPGEVIQRQSLAGVTIIEGRRVPIFEAKVKAPKVSPIPASVAEGIKIRTSISSAPISAVPRISPTAAGVSTSLRLKEVSGISTGRFQRTLVSPVSPPVPSRPVSKPPRLESPSIVFPSPRITISPISPIGSVSRGGGSGRPRVPPPSSPVLPPPTRRITPPPRRPFTPVKIPEPLKPVRFARRPRPEQRRRTRQPFTSRAFKFQPSVVAVARGITREEEPKLLTGLKIRPIIKV